MHVAMPPVMSPSFFKRKQGIVMYSGDGLSQTVLYEGYDCRHKTCRTQTMVVTSGVRFFFFCDSVAVVDTLTLEASTSITSPLGVTIHLLVLAHDGLHDLG